MFLLKDILLPKKMGILIFVKISAFILLARICYLYNELCLNNNILYKTYMPDDALGIRIIRLLSRGELEIKNERSKLLDKSLDYINNRRIRKGAENISKYNKSGKNNLSKLELYRKDYKKRYNRKKGIAKLECYYENKIFDKIDCAYSLKEKMQNEKKLFKRFGLPIILISFCVFLGSIIPILSYMGITHNKTLCNTSGSGLEGKHADCISYAKKIITINNAIFYPLSIIFFLGIIYFIDKVLKYKSLKHVMIK